MQVRTIKSAESIKTGVKSTQGYPTTEYGKKKHKEDYTTYTCSLPCLSFSPCSVAWQPRVLSPHLVSIFFTDPSLYDFNLYRKFFTLSFPPFFVCFRHKTLSCKDWQYSKQSQQSGKACFVHMMWSQRVHHCLHIVVHDSC